MKIYLTPADAAVELGVTPATIRNLADRRQLRVAATTKSGIRLFEESDVITLAARRAKERSDS